jgi:uncharacterized protein YndB with AHSA1/START domain
MSTYTTSKFVQASPERTFDAFTDLERAPEVVEAIQALEVLGDGRIGVGTRFRETRIMMKRETTEEMVITAFERPQSYVVEAEACGSAFATTFRFVPENGGTRVDLEMNARPITFLAKLMSPLSGMMMGACMKQLRGDMDAMAAVAEDKASPRLATA